MSYLASLWNLPSQLYRPLFGKQSTLDTRLSSFTPTISTMPPRPTKRSVTFSTKSAKKSKLTYGDWLSHIEEQPSEALYAELTTTSLLNSKEKTELLATLTANLKIAATNKMREDGSAQSEIDAARAGYQELYETALDELEDAQEESGTSGRTSMLRGTTTQPPADFSELLKSLTGSLNSATSEPSTASKPSSIISLK